MGKGKIDSADYTNLRNKDYDGTAAGSDQDIDYTIAAIDDTTQNSYQAQWSTWYGYYKADTLLRSLIDRVAIWTIGKGYEADKKAKKHLDRWRGNGKSTANTLFNNFVKVFTIGGDFYGEIIGKRKNVKNIKPLNPGSIKIVADDFGRIKKYEQWTNRALIGKGKPNIFKPDEIFHLAWNGLADDIHGRGVIENMKNIIKMRQEAMNDLKTVFHRYVKPLIISHVDTDDTTEISAYKAKLDKTIELGENLVVPKDTVDKMDTISIPQFSTLDPIPWIKLLRDEYLRAEGIPDVVLGVSADETEATSKIMYLAFQQVIEWKQMFLQEQIKAQLGYEINFKFPVKIDDLVGKDQQKARKTGKIEPGFTRNS